jgi:hypothetical protein
VLSTTLLGMVACGLGVAFGAYLFIKFQFRSFVNSVNNFSCSLFNLYLELRNGVNENVIPHWIGVDKIIVAINSTLKEIKNLDTSYASSFSTMDKLNDETEKYVNGLGSFYSTYSKSYLNNSNPASSKRNTEEKIFPNYMDYIGNYTKANTTLNYIFQEYSTNLQSNLDTVQNAEKASRQIQNYNLAIDSLLGGLSSRLTELKTNLDKISEDIISPVANGVIILFYYFIATSYK